MDDFYMCECGGEGISVCDMDEDWIGLSIWHGYTYRPPLHRKIALIWHILRRGHPWLDDVILTKEKARELADRLKEMADAE